MAKNEITELIRTEDGDPVYLSEDDSDGDGNPLYTLEVPSGMLTAVELAAIGKRLIEEFGRDVTAQQVREILDRK